MFKQGMLVVVVWMAGFFAVGTVSVHAEQRGTLGVSWGTAPPSVVAVGEEFTVSVNANYDPDLDQDERAAGDPQYEYSWAPTPDSTQNGGKQATFSFQDPSAAENDKSIQVTVNAILVVEGPGDDGVWDTADDEQWTLTPENDPVTVSSDLTAVNLEGIVVTDAPSYAEEIEGTNVTNGDFEIEKGDTVSLKAMVTPDNCGNLLIWEGDGVSGSGTSKSPQYTSTGTQNITLKCGPQEVSTTVYVNDNANPNHSISPALPSIDKAWAHCGDETINLTASSTASDHDYVEGELLTSEEDNRVDLEGTTWAVPVGRGQVQPTCGETTIYTPPFGQGCFTGQFPCTVGYNDETDDYSPRDESETTVDIMLGCFKTKVQLQLTGDCGTKTKTVDEDGNVSGDSTVSVQDNIHVEAQVDRQDWYTDPPVTDNPDPVTKSVSLAWTYLTIPGNAEPDGTIEAKLSVDGSADLKTKLYDEDLNDGSTQVSLGISAGSPVGFGFATTIQWGEDECEGTAAVGAGFSSEAGILGISHPDSYKLEETSCTYYESSLPAIKSADPAFSHTRSNPVTRAKGTNVHAQFDFYAKAKAISRGLFWAYAHGWCENIDVSADVTEVGYNPSSP